MKKYFPKLKTIGVWIFLTVIFFTSIGFAVKNQEQIKCRNINIKILNADKFFFVEKEDILEEFHRHGYTLYYHPVSSINTYVLEKIIKSNPFISKAEVFYTLNGDVQIRVVQREPVLRVINKNSESFYVDKEGKYMPISDKFTAHVVVASGNIDARLKEGSIDAAPGNIVSHLFEISTFIQQDKFWRSQVEQLFVNADGDIEITPRIGSHQILIGDSNDLGQKLNRMLAFYDKAVKRSGWKKYKAVNLKYKNQIVCTLNNQN